MSCLPLISYVCTYFCKHFITADSAYFENSSEYVCNKIHFSDICKEDASQRLITYGRVELCSRLFRYAKLPLTLCIVCVVSTTYPASLRQCGWTLTARPDLSTASQLSTERLLILHSVYLQKCCKLVALRTTFLKHEELRYESLPSAVAAWLETAPQRKAHFWKRCYLWSSE